MFMKQRIFALGFFDGVHLGHQALLDACVQLAAELGVQPAAITFLAHPQSLFMDTPPKLLTTHEDRVALLRQFGVDSVYSYPVTSEVMGMHWEVFLEELVGFGAAGFVCGADFRFGHRGMGNALRLREFCESRKLPCVIVEDRELDGIRISSSHIRGLLEKGLLEEANRFLGHPHILSGEVVAGRQLGRTIGIPTANLILPRELLCPRHGVYACVAEVDGKRYAAVTNIGSRPTVGGHRVTVEPWLLDFAADLYGKKLRLELHAFLREERKFGSLEELKAAILENEQQTRKLLGQLVN